MEVYLATAPASEPITRAEAKAQLTLEHALDDAMVDALILAARKWAEEYCWRGFVTQTWELVAPCFPADGGLPFNKQGFELPKGNLGAITWVKYIDGSGVQQTLDPAEYSANTVAVPGRVLRAYGKSWPSHRSQWDAVRVRYTVGWAVDAVPEPIKQALLMLVSQMYEHRTPEVTGTIISAVGFAVTALLGPYRLVR